MKSLAELAAIREKMQSKVVIREGAATTRVVVGMATCGIAAGARPVLNAFVDGINKDTSVERDFAVALDNADEVCVYAKLPRGFYIPTPVGNYSPDWAIAFNEGTVKHIYFVAETKGSLDSLQLRAVERAKIDCARKLFNEISTSKVRYEYVSTYTDLLNKMNALA